MEVIMIYIEPNDLFIKISAPAGMRLTDGDILLGNIAYVPLNSDTSTFRAIMEEEAEEILNRGSELR